MKWYIHIMIFFFLGISFATNTHHRNLDACKLVHCEMYYLSPYTDYPYSLNLSDVKEIVSKGKLSSKVILANENCINVLKKLDTIIQNDKDLKYYLINNKPKQFKNHLSDVRFSIYFTNSCGRINVIGFDKFKNLIIDDKVIRKKPKLFDMLYEIYITQ